MLDAFIIERIRQEELKRSEKRQVPLHIHVPEIQDQRPEEPQKPEEPSERGCEVLDFTLSTRDRTQEVLSLA